MLQLNRVSMPPAWESYTSLFVKEMMMMIRVVDAHSRHEARMYRRYTQGSV